MTRSKRTLSRTPPNQGQDLAGHVLFVSLHAIFTSWKTFAGTFEPSMTMQVTNRGNWSHHKVTLCAWSGAPLAVWPRRNLNGSPFCNEEINAPGLIRARNKFIRKIGCAPLLDFFCPMQTRRARPRNASRALQLHAEATEKLFLDSKENIKPTLDSCLSY